MYSVVAMKSGDSLGNSYQKGLSRSVIEHISSCKREPHWMRSWRLAAYERFKDIPLPTWGVDLSGLDFSEICFYSNPIHEKARSWQDVPADIKDMFQKLGIAQAEQYALAGVSAQYESEVLYEHFKETWSSQGVIFCSMDDAINIHADMVQKYIGSIVPCDDNKFAALNSAVWSGGTFVYVPENVTVELPVQAYFRIQAEHMGQFERTLIIADKGSRVHYIEGCSAPLYSTQSLHSAVVEIYVADGAHVRYTTIQNWSTNVYNLVTKRACVGSEGYIEWIDGNFGGRATMKYPCMVLQGDRARGYMMSLAMSGPLQHQHTGAKIVHRGCSTHATVISKAVCHSGGVSSYVGSVNVEEGALDAHAHVQCDVLLLDGYSRATSGPYINVAMPDARVGHEASVSSLDSIHMNYLASRGIDYSVARALVINGFVSDFVQELPMEYAVELNRLIASNMDGSIG
jgi:Fe-S cluster assembly protein SufB